MTKKLPYSIDQKTKFCNDLIGENYYDENYRNWPKREMHYESETDGNNETKYLPCLCEKCKWFIEHEKTKKWREKPCGCNSCYYSHLSVDLRMILEFDERYPGFLFSDVAYKTLKNLQEPWYLKVHEEEFILNQQNLENFDAYIEKFKYKDQIIDGLMNDEMTKNLDFMETNFPTLAKIERILKHLQTKATVLQTTVVNEMLAYKELYKLLEVKLVEYVSKKENQEIAELKAKQNESIKQDLEGQTIELVRKINLLDEYQVKYSSKDEDELNQLDKTIRKLKKKLKSKRLRSVQLDKERKEILDKHKNTIVKCLKS